MREDAPTRRTRPPRGRGRRAGGLALLAAAAFVVPSSAAGAQEREAWPDCLHQEPLATASAGPSVAATSPDGIAAARVVLRTVDPGSDGLLDGTLLGAGLGLAAGLAGAVLVSEAAGRAHAVHDPMVLYMGSGVSGIAIGSVAGLGIDALTGPADDPLVDGALRGGGMGALVGALASVPLLAVAGPHTGDRAPGLGLVVGGGAASGAAVGALAGLVVDALSR